MRLEVSRMNHVIISGERARKKMIEFLKQHYRRNMEKLFTKTTKLQITLPAVYRYSCEI